MQTGVGAGEAILAELRQVLAAAADLPEQLAEVLSAPRVLIHGQGRAGLVLQGLAMRLGQMGRDAHWLGDTAPRPLRPGDAFLANASAGDLPTSVALLARARALGARTAVLTAAAAGPALDVAETVLRLPAQTRAGESVLPLGGQYELALWVVCDLAVGILLARLGIPPQRLADGHVNLG
jgi:6-phospho-3-hexuloisomerase